MLKSLAIYSSNTEWGNPIPWLQGWTASGMLLSSLDLAVFTFETHRELGTLLSDY